MCHYYTYYPLQLYSLSSTRSVFWRHKTLKSDVICASTKDWENAVAAHTLLRRTCVQYLAIHGLYVFLSLQQIENVHSRLSIGNAAIHRALSRQSGRVKSDKLEVTCYVNKVPGACKCIYVYEIYITNSVSCRAINSGRRVGEPFIWYRIVQQCHFEAFPTPSTFLFGSDVHPAELYHGCDCPGFSWSNHSNGNFAFDLKVIFSNF